MQLTDYLASLTITQGRRAGELLTVLPWQARFVRGAFGEGVQSAALSVGRGNGKSTLVAGIACSALDGPLAVPRSEVLIVAASYQQGRVCFDHLKAFMDDRLTDKRTWRVQDTMQVAIITNRQTGASVRVLGSDPRRAHGLAPVLVLCDEPAQWPESTATRMVAALRTAAGKQPHCRFVALGTRAADATHWFEKMLTGGADFAMSFAAAPGDPPYRKRTWRKAKPSMAHMPDLVKGARLRVRYWRPCRSPGPSRPAPAALRPSPPRGMTAAPKPPSSPPRSSFTSRTTHPPRNPHHPAPGRLRAGRGLAGVRLEKRRAAQLVTRSPRRTLAPIAKHAARERRRAHRRRPSGGFGPCAGRKGADKVTMRRELAQISAHIRQLSFILLVRTDRTPSLEILDERWCQRNLVVRETDFHCSQHKLNRRLVCVYGFFGRPVVSDRRPVVLVFVASIANCTKGFDRAVRDKTATLQSFDAAGLAVPLELLLLAFVWCVDQVNEDRHLLGHHSTESDGADVVADEITRLGLTQGAEQIFHEFGFLKGEKQPLVLCAHLAVTHLEGSHVGRETK